MKKILSLNCLFILNISKDDPKRNPFASQKVKTLRMWMNKLCFPNSRDSKRFWILKYNRGMGGFSILSSLFILVAFSLLCVSLIKMWQPVLSSSSLEQEKIQANFAALSALALAEQQWLRQPKACPLWSLHFDDKADGLAGYKVEIMCPSLYIYPKIEPKCYTVQIKAVVTKKNVSKVVEQWMTITEPTFANTTS